jgi:Leucine-rich repeat (LRR) protein
MNRIGGTIPTVISKLTDLTLIDVEENLLTGPAFLDISAFSDLTSYRVSLNSLTGTIPDSFSPEEGLSLKEIWFSSNRIPGTIPESLFSSNTQLTSVIVNRNLLVGSIPSTIGLLSDLETLQLHNNAFVSTIPMDLYSNTLLKDLRLDGNLLTGTLSTMLGNLVNLDDLRLGGNPLTGTLPAEIARLSNLGTFLFEYVTYTISLHFFSRYGPMLSALKLLPTVILSVNATNLAGVVRDSFEPFTKLRFLDLSKNRFTGTLPESLFDSSAIELLYISDNALTGSIPSNYGNAISLRDLYINNNMLVGTVPPVLPGQLGNLTEFLVSGNGLTGTMPASICALRGDDPENDLFNLVSDCGGVSPLIQCDCCNGCVTPPAK